jgi:hypothetical protein
MVGFQVPAVDQEPNVSVLCMFLLNILTIL